MSTLKNSLKLLIVKPSAVSDIESVQSIKDRQQIIKRIGLLRDNPRPPGCTKLSGYDRYRIRHGPYCIVYGIEDDALVVYVVKDRIQTFRAVNN